MLHLMPKRKTDKVKHYDSFDELPKGAKQVYESLRDLGPKYMDENLWIYIFNEELAEFSQVSKNSISHQLSVLEGNEYIESEKYFDDDAINSVRRIRILKRIYPNLD